jgi:DNA-binding MarR family transcriptional regulator
VGIELTDEGDRVLASVKRRRTAWLADHLRNLEPNELDAIDAALEPLAKLLDEDATQ